MKKLIGYGYTNSSGVATMTKNASGGNVSGYTGTGAGLMNFRAEMHDDSTVVSEPYAVWDTIKYDNGTTDTNIWTTAWSTTEYDRTTNPYSSLTVGQIYNNFTPTGDFAIDFDLCVKGGRSNWFWYCVQNSSNFGGCGVSSLGLSIDTWNKIHMEFTNTKITVTNDYNSTVYEIPVDISTSAQIQYRFNINGSITEIDFKNFKIYYI